MKPYASFLAIVFTALGIASVHAQGAAPDCSGDFWSRPALTGGWGGLRNQLAEKGIAFEVDFGSVIQSVLSGRDETTRWSGWNVMNLKLDSQRLGLWPRGFLFVRGEAAYNHPVNTSTGAIMPVNLEPLLPSPARNEFVVSAVMFTQFLSEQFGITLGKLDTVSGDMNEFAHGRGDVQFMNLALQFNPTPMRVVPYSPLGLALAYLPVRIAGGSAQRRKISSFRSASSIRKGQQPARGSIRYSRTAPLWLERDA